MSVGEVTESTFFNLQLWSVLWSVAAFVHKHFTLRVLVDSQTDRFIFEIIDLIQVSEHDISNQEQSTAASLKLVLVDGKLTLVALSLVEVQVWSKLEHHVVDLESDWLQLRGDGLAGLFDEAEVVIVNAVHVSDCFVPLVL